MIELRDYQEEAIQTVLEKFKTQSRVMIQLPTGSGKTILFNEVIKRLTDSFSLRIVMAVDLKDLVLQTKNKFIETYPEKEHKTGIICSSLQSKKDIGAEIIFSTIQTLARVLNVLGKIDVLIIDECHSISDTQRSTQFNRTLHILEKTNPKLRVLGVTATPFKVGHGMTYGRKCRKDRTNFFPTLDYKKSISELTEAGYLSPLRFKVAKKIDLSNVKITAGEYNTKNLSEEMEKNVHLEEAVKAYKNFGENRKHCLVFAVTIDHAELMAETLRSHGYIAEATHSKIDNKLRAEKLEAFKAGKIHFLCSVSTLIKGIDMTIADIALILRPTKSISLYIQTIGRLTRKHPGKKDALILDLSNNVITHGDPDNPIISVPNPPPERIIEDIPERGQALKECPGCKKENSLKEIKCWFCGYLWQSHLGDFKMVYVDWSLKGNVTEAEGFIDKIYLTEHHSFVSSNKSLRVNVIIGNEEVSNFYSFQPKILGMFHAFWRKATGSKEYPETIEEAIKRSDEININYVIIKKRDKYWKISSFLRK